MRVPNRAYMANLRIVFQELAQQAQRVDPEQTLKRENAEDPMRAVPLRDIELIRTSPRASN